MRKRRMRVSDVLEEMAKVENDAAQDRHDAAYIEARVDGHTPGAAERIAARELLKGEG